MSYPNRSDCYPLQWVKPVVYIQERRTKVYLLKVGPSTLSSSYDLWLAILSCCSSYCQPDLWLVSSSSNTSLLCGWGISWVAVDPQALTWMIIEGLTIVHMNGIKGFWQAFSDHRYPPSCTWLSNLITPSIHSLFHHPLPTPFINNKTKYRFPNCLRHSPT